MRNLFSFRETNCDTHDLLDCPCDGDGILLDRDLLTQEIVPEEEQGFTLASKLKDQKVCLKKRFIDDRRNINLMRCMNSGISIQRSGKHGMMMRNFFVILLKMIF